MAALNIQSDAAPVGTVKYGSDGDTIPYSASGGEAIGDVIIRNTAENAIGVVTGVAPDSPATATAGDELELRVKGMIFAPLNPGTVADGDRLIWQNSTSRFEKNTAGPHEAVGTYTSSSSYIWARINLGCACGVAPSASPSASPSSSPSASPSG